MTVDSSHEEDLLHTPPLSHDDLQLYESKFHGPFNHSIGKLLHVQQWTRTDITYAVTHLASFTKNPNKPHFCRGNSISANFQLW